MALDIPAWGRTHLMRRQRLIGARVVLWGSGVGEWSGRGLFRARSTCQSALVGGGAYSIAFFQPCAHHAISSSLRGDHGLRQFRALRVLGHVSHDLAPLSTAPLVVRDHCLGLNPLRVAGKGSPCRNASRHWQPYRACVPRCRRLRLATVAQFAE